MKRKAPIAAAMVMAGSFLLQEEVKAAIEPPLSPGETWYVCRGYNVKTHGGPALDLTVTNNSWNTEGCTIGAYDSTGKTVHAPKSGNVSYHLADMMCLSFDDGSGSMLIGHFANRKPEGHKDANAALGILSAPYETANGGYAHIHIQAHNGSGCTSATLVPFDDANGMRLEDAPNMTNGLTIPSEWRGTKLTRAAASAWHPAGTLIRAVDDDKVYYLKRDGTTGKLKRRHIVNETVFNNSGYNWNEIVVVSPQERDCYDAGTTVTAPESDLLKAWLVIPEGDYKVYAISENQLRWLNLTPEEFVSVGYQWGNVGTLHANHNIPYGVSLTMQDFRTCERNKQSPPPPPPPAKKANGATCSDRSECASNWCQPIPDGTKYCMSERKSCSVPGSDGIATWEFQTFGGQVYQCQPGNVYAPWVSPIVLSGTIANGQVCDPANPKQCSSGYCEIGPDAHYCVGPKSHCAKPGTEGSKWNESYVYNGKTYDCMFPSGIISRNANRDVTDGMLCLDWKDCASRCCFPGPRDRFYCVNAKKNCVQPGKEGVMYRDTFLYDHILYECVSPGETVEIGP